MIVIGVLLSINILISFVNLLNNMRLNDVLIDNIVNNVEEDNL